MPSCHTIADYHVHVPFETGVYVTDDYEKTSAKETWIHLMYLQQCSLQAAWGASSLPKLLSPQWVEGQGRSSRIT